MYDDTDSLFSLIGPDGRRADITQHTEPDKGRPRPTITETQTFKASVRNGKFRLVAYGYHGDVVELWLSHRQAKALNGILTKRTTEVWPCDD